MGFFSSGKPKATVVDPLAAQKTKAADYLTGKLGETPNIPTQQIAGMTGTEQLGQKILGNYAAAGVPKEYQQGIDVINKFLTQSGDITKLPEYKAILADSANQTNEAVNQALRRIQISGMGSSTPQGRAVGKEIAAGQNRTVAQLAPFAAQARTDQQNAINQLAQFIQMGQNFDLNKLNAISSYGALPRTIEQAQKDAAFNALYQKIMFPYTQGADVAGRVLSGSVDTAVQPGDPSMFSQIIGPAAQLGGSAMIAAALSDIRSKDDVQPIENALEKVKVLAGKTYRYKGDTARRYAGVIAQDVQKVLPEAVDLVGDYLYVRFDGLIALLVNAVKELSSKVENELKVRT